MLSPLKNNQTLLERYPSTTTIRRGPAYLHEPLFRLSHEFWPSRSDLRTEADYVRQHGDKQMVVPIIDEVDAYAQLEFQFAHDKTPALNMFLSNFISTYGDLGHLFAHYFYIDSGMNYVWHRDNVPSVDHAGFAVQCCINIVVTDDESECEFLNFEPYKYTAAVLNTSVLHRVTPTSNRILARISFVDAIYEEVVSRIRKTEKKNERMDNK